MARIDDRAALRARYNFACGYCGVREADAGAELTVDHFQPRSRGGSDDAANLVFCCHACNEFKGHYWPKVGSQRPSAPESEQLLHPQHDDVAAHVAPNDDGTLRGLTPRGEFHIRRLRLNRPPLVLHRCERPQREASLRAEREEQARLAARIARLETLVDALLLQIQEEPPT